MKNKLNVTIDGIALTVGTDYSEEKVKTLVEEATGRLSKIKSQFRSCSTLNASLLLLLELIDNNRQLTEECNRLRQKAESMELDLEIQYMENERLNQKKNNPVKK